MTPYGYEFLESAEKEFLALPHRDRRLFKEKLLYLLRNPFRSYPWLRVRPGTRHPGEWRFHLREYRVFYRVDGLTVVFTRIVLRPKAYPRRSPKPPRTRRRRSVGAKVQRPSRTLGAIAVPGDDQAGDSKDPAMFASRSPLGSRSRDPKYRLPQGKGVGWEDSFRVWPRQLSLPLEPDFNSTDGIHTRAGKASLLGAPAESRPVRSNQFHLLQQRLEPWISPNGLQSWIQPPGLEIDEAILDQFLQ